MSLIVLIGCGHSVGPVVDAGNDADTEIEIDASCALVLCDDHNPCAVTTCSEDGGCARTSAPEGTICEGVATDPVHGECSGDPVAPICNITEWTCIKMPPGTPCNTGTGTCDSYKVCCSGGCINTKGQCDYGPPYGGLPCST